MECLPIAIYDFINRVNQADWSAFCLACLNPFFCLLQRFMNETCFVPQDVAWFAKIDTVTYSLAALWYRKNYGVLFSSHCMDDIQIFLE